MFLALSENQLAAVRLAVRGLSAREIGEELGIAESAAHTRLRAARVCLGARNLHHLTALAVERGLATPRDPVACVEGKRAA